MKASWLRHFSTRPRKPETHSSDGRTQTSNPVQTFPITLVKWDGRSVSDILLLPGPSDSRSMDFVPPPAAEEAEYSSRGGPSSSPRIEHREDEVEEEIEDGAVVVVEEEDARGPGLLVYDALEYTAAGTDCEAAIAAVTGGVVLEAEQGSAAAEEDTVLLALLLLLFVVILVLLTWASTEQYCDAEGSLPQPLYRGNGVMMMDLSSARADDSTPPLITSFSI